MRATTFLSAIFTACFFHAVLPAGAQCPPAGDLNITATLYTQENGLASNMNVGMCRDSTGFRYFLGVDGRWIRYDGILFSAQYDQKKILSDRFDMLKPENGHTVLQYRNAVLYKVQKNDRGVTEWAIIKDSLICFNASKNNYHSFALPEGIKLSREIDFFPSGELCWITADNGIFCFSYTLQSFSKINSDHDHVLREFVPQITIDEDGEAYIISNGQLFKLNAETLRAEYFCDLSNDKEPSIFTIIVKDRLFTAGQQSFFYEADLRTGKAKKIDLEKYAETRNKSALKITAIVNYEDHILIGTSNAGMFIYDPCTGEMRSYQYAKKNADAARTNFVTWIVADVENVIWMQTDGGLLKLEVNSQSIRTFFPSVFRYEGLCNNCDNVRTVLKLNTDTLVIGTLQGLFLFDQRTQKFGELISPVSGKPVWDDVAIGSVTDDDGENIFIASWADEGILLWNTKKEKLINILPAQLAAEHGYNFIRCIFYDSHRVLWVGTDNVLLRITNLQELEKNDFSGRTEVEDALRAGDKKTGQMISDCFSIAEDAQQNIWIGTGNGIYVYSYTTGDVKHYQHNEDNSTSLSDNSIRCIYKAKNGTMWIGTNSGGLCSFNAATDAFTTFTTENGLPNNSIYSIAEDVNGNFWLGTNGGLCRFNRTDHSIRNYTPRDGIQNFEFNRSAICTTADGNLCFGGRTGFNIFDPDSMNTTFAPPPVIITRFRIFDKEFPLSGSVVRLPHDENSFSFDFAALNYFRSSDNQYTYMLEGADKDWIKAGSRQYTSYANLPPGKYTFKVKAANYTGIWNNEATTMQIIISPAWYSTWWFSGIILLLAAAFIYSLYKYRLRQMLKLQSLRNRIASDLHDEIGSTLSSISLSSTIIQKKLKGSNNEAEKLLQQVSNNTDSMMEALSDIVWAINTRNDRFDNIINRMRAFAIEISEPAGISIQFNIDDNIQDLQLNMQQRKDLYLIFKEAIHNSMKYADCKNISLHIEKQGNKTLCMTIQDDGIGFDMLPVGEEEPSLSGNGIKNMKKRAEELGGKLEITSVKGKGTAIQLVFRL